MTTMNFDQDCLRTAGLLHAPSLEQWLGDSWTSAEIRACYHTACRQVLHGRPLILLQSLADIDGYSRLYQAGDDYLFESIDCWDHYVNATEPLMHQIIAAMEALRS
ncbi:hypothetical protein [Chitinophaga nivalis]|uniref:CdiI immunity protein domain-containing protein n=1 Tax=Chitinophaga nivalis TaxID=2991709 RepID=A0ABT3IIK1_9BACT|nr:hypothetical protein [Chitinophaga nivalis]MCW3466730.1 hypothetical protein [Chitinophaga nivalis]MCW3483579.1 hypothetical protein [Chitinophaga nivalis]